jgi:single-strand DNA-binding protein
MAFSINRATLVGTVGKDAEVKYTGSGKAAASFTMATSEQWKDGSGQKQEKTEWHNVTAWNWLAEYAGENVKKGTKVLVEGKIVTESYEKEGEKRYITKIQAETIMALERTQKTGNSTQPAQSYQSKENVQESAPDTGLPF